MKKLSGAPTVLNTKAIAIGPNVKPVPEQLVVKMIDAYEASDLKDAQRIRTERLPVWIKEGWVIKGK